MEYYFLVLHILMPQDIFLYRIFNSFFSTVKITKESQSRTAIKCGAKLISKSIDKLLDFRKLNYNRHW